MKPSNYVAPRGLSFDAHFHDWKAHAERRFDARMQGDSLELTIFDVIGDPWEGVTAAKVKSVLDQNSGAKSITVLINSPGGFTDEGVAIFNLLRRHPATVTVEVMGEAASAASVVAMAGDRILMRPGTWMMVHEAWTIGAGNAEALARSIEMLKTVTSSAVDIYALRTKRPATEIAKLLKAETWMGTAEAIAGKFADAVIDTPQAPSPSTQSRSSSAPVLAEMPMFRGFSAPSAPMNLAPPQGVTTMQHETLTALERKVCEATGTTEAAYLERKKFEAKQQTEGRDPQAVNPGHDVSPHNSTMARNWTMAGSPPSWGSRFTSTRLAEPPAYTQVAVAMTALEREVCEKTGMSEAVYLDRKRFEAYQLATDRDVEAVNPYAVSLSGT